MVIEYQNEIANGNLQPERAAEILVALASLSGNINDEILKRDVEYNKELLRLLETEEKVGTAKIKAQISPQYQTKKEAENIKELNTELIRSLKYYLQAKREEYSQGRNF